MKGNWWIPQPKQWVTNNSLEWTAHPLIFTFPESQKDNLIKKAITDIATTLLKKWANKLINSEM
jgi:hypothetical protein